MSQLLTAASWINAVDTFVLGLRLLVLLTVANCAPILATRLLDGRWNWPIDAGRRFIDGRRWLGPSKTWRGLAAAILATAAVAPALGFGPGVGALCGLLSMAGDASASFIKRRLDVAPGGACFGLDQLPECLLPLMAMQHALALPWEVVIGTALAFLLLERPGAWLFHRLGLREQSH